MTSTVHTLKVWPEYFRAIRTGQKKFEVRRGNDREYKTGDHLRLREYLPIGSCYTGREIEAEVGYVMHGGPWLPEDVWVFSLEGPFLYSRVAVDDSQEGRKA